MERSNPGFHFGGPAHFRAGLLYAGMKRVKKKTEQTGTMRLRIEQAIRALAARAGSGWRDQINWRFRD
jgi:hypothetical protein